MVTTGRNCLFWHSWYVVDECNCFSYISNVLSIKTILFDILDFWCQLVVIWFVKTLSKSYMFVSSIKFQRVDYYTAWSYSTKSVETRDLPNHGQTCGHRFADVIWRIPNPILMKIIRYSDIKVFRHGPFWSSWERTFWSSWEIAAVRHPWLISCGRLPETRGGFSAER